MQVTSIVAYRNPLEMWLWESGFIWVWAAIVVVFAVNIFWRIYKKTR